MKKIYLCWYLEGGEALRIEDSVIREAVRGTLSVMSHLGMLPSEKTKAKQRTSYVAKSSYWVRYS